MVCLFHNLLSQGKINIFPFRLSSFYNVTIRKHFECTLIEIHSWLFSHGKPFFFCFCFFYILLFFDIIVNKEKDFTLWSSFSPSFIYATDFNAKGKQLAPYSQRFDVLWGYGIYSLFFHSLLLLFALCYFLQLHNLTKTLWESSFNSLFKCNWIFFPTKTYTKCATSKQFN